MIRNLMEVVALVPNTAVLADDGGGGEAVAFDFAHQVLVHVRLPRHFLLYFLTLSLSYSSIRFRDGFWGFGE